MLRNNSKRGRCSTTMLRSSDLRTHYWNNDMTWRKEHLWNGSVLLRVHLVELAELEFSVE
jgi:hypothetical protein